MTMHLLGNLSIDEFLRDYWQQKPVLIRNAWPNFEPLLSAQELAGLSLNTRTRARWSVGNSQRSILRDRLSLTPKKSLDLTDPSH